MSTETHLTPFITRDGHTLAVQDWPLASSARPRGVVLLVHGLGEHVGRYEHVARRLNQWGFSVRGYDHWGHGESTGAPGSLPTDTRLLDDLAEVMDATRAKHPAEPLILLGHSLGGLVVGRLVSLALRPVDALVMSSPALDPGLSAFQKLLVAVLPKLVPNLRVGNGLNAKWISHDPAVVQAYQQDPKVHDRISARLARFIAEGGPATLALAAQWKVPTLLMYAGQDKLVNPRGSQQFAASAPPQVVQAHCFDALYHEIFNEQDAEPVFDTLRTWLDARF